MQAPPSPTLDLRDRFVGFAFAAADLLAEIDGERRVRFAAGAFRERFGQEAESFTGKKFAQLIAPEDLAGLEIGLSLLTARGRLAPISLRLNTPERPLLALSGLRLPHRQGISWLTLARMPAPPPADTAALAAGPLFREAVEARISAELPCGLGLVEVGGWQNLPAAQRRDLEVDIAAALREAGGAGAMAGEMAAGRFGVLGGEAIEMGELQDRVGRILRAAGAGRPVAGTTIPLAQTGLGAQESIRAMRFALTCFGAKGTQAVREAGFDAGLRHFLDRTEAQAGAVRAAIENGRFRMVYQPVVRLADRSIHHFEALLRPFPISGHENSSTQEFVGFVEALGMAELLDRAVLRRASETLAGARARVAVNVSGLSMQSPGFRAELMELIERTPAIASQLLVELTETADIEDVPAAVETVNRLAAAGVPVCLDDFGAGFAAFRYLKEFHVDFVKIDGSYVQSAATGARDSGFVGAMVELARCAGAAAIAEMIETEAQAATMMALGVEFGQGWLFGRPGALPGAR